MIDQALYEKCQSIQAIVFDCDGVLTPGDLVYSEAGERSLRFSARDGVGCALAARSGLKLGILSGRPTDVAERRFRELGVKAFLGGCRDKFTGIQSICDALEVPLERTAFVGDDLPDLGALVRVGLPIAVADAAPEVLERADWVLSARGGHGAAREVCETILKAQGQWQSWIEKFLGRSKA